MKKIFLFLFLFLFVFQTKAFAQVAGFDNSKQTRVSVFPFGKAAQQIDLPPSTTVFIDPGTFSNSAQVILTPGVFPSMKALLPKNQSPIASYSLIAYDSDGNQLFPKKPIRIESYNNFAGTDTFYYPVTSDGIVDAAGVKKSQGQVKATGNITQNDPGFIVAVNKTLSEDQTVIIPNTQAAPPQKLTPLQIIGQFKDLIIIAVLIIILVFLAVMLRKKVKIVRNGN